MGERESSVVAELFRVFKLLLLQDLSYFVLLYLLSNFDDNKKFLENIELDC